MVAITSQNRIASLKIAGRAALVLAAAAFAPSLAGAAETMPPPAPACPLELPEIVVPAPVQGPPTTSTRVLRVVARNQSHFAVQITFDGPFVGGTQTMQEELMRSVADELGLPGAPDPEE